MFEKKPKKKKSKKTPLPLIKIPKLSIFTWIFIFFIVYQIFDSFNNASKLGKKVNLTEFTKMIEDKNFTNVEMTDDFIVAKNKEDYNIFTSYPSSYANNLIDKLNKNEVSINFVSKESLRSPISKFFSIFASILSWLPFLLIIYFFRKMSNSSKNNKDGGVGLFGGGAFSFGKSKARLIKPEEIDIKLADVAGMDESKKDVEEIIDFLKNPSKYQKIGGKMPKGCLLTGQPGTGKTMLAKAVAKEASVPFLTISGSDFVEMFVGVGASRVRDLFAKAKANSPCIIFMDEIDAIGRQRGGAGTGGGNDEREQTLNQLLVEMDGFTENTGVVVIAATNRPEILDKALLRPGRFDRRVDVPLPDISGRNEILNIHSKKIKLSKSVDLAVLARGTPGFSGAELSNLLNESAILAARGNKEYVTEQEIEMARDKMLMGSERTTMIMTEREKQNTAFHEAGHALVAHSLPDSDPIHKATILPRGRSLGLVMRLPETDRISMKKATMDADMAVAIAGRIAEEIIFGSDQITSGASSDIQQLTKIARKMVTEWGFSSKLGYVNYEKQDPYSSSTYHASDKYAETIDAEVKEIIDNAYNVAKTILEQNFDNLHKLANALLKYETLTGEEINKLLSSDIEIDQLRIIPEMKVEEKKKKSKLSKF